MMDKDIQLEILNKLCEYGDSLLDEENHSEDGLHKQQTNQLATDVTASKVKRKKKKKKKLANGIQSISTAKKISKHNSLREFEEELRTFRDAQSEDKRREQDQLDRRREGAMTESGKWKGRELEVIVFHDPSRRTKRKHNDSPEHRDRTGPDKTDSASAELDLDKVRHDVWKFGLTGFSFEDKEKHEAAKAIQLGAKAPGKDYVNYKEYMETQKQRKLEEQKQREINRQMGLKTPKNKNEKIHLKNKGFWTDKMQKKSVYIDGQIGKFKRGVQVISKKDVTKVKARTGGPKKK